MSTYADTAHWEIQILPQAGLSSGASEQLPGAAVWRKLRLQPFNLSNPEAPRPAECQVWPRGIQQRDPA